MLTLLRRQRPMELRLGIGLELRNLQIDCCHCCTPEADLSRKSTNWNGKLDFEAVKWLFGAKRVILAIFSDTFGSEELNIGVKRFFRAFPEPLREIKKAFQSKKILLREAKITYLAPKRYFTASTYNFPSRGSHFWLKSEATVSSGASGGIVSEKRVSFFPVGSLLFCS